MNEDEDEIIQEIPVYVSKSLVKQLFVFQYPTTPSHSTHEDQVVRSCIKPRLQEVELDLGIDVKSSNYDSGHGEQIAINADGLTGGGKVGEEKVFSSGKMDYMTLKSQKLLNDTNNYAAGILNDGELHLTPLQGIVSMRPTFSYLDKSDKRQGQTPDDGSGSEEEQQLRQVTVTFARQENDKTKKAREQSYDYHSKMSSSEQWYQTNYVPSNTDEAELERTKLYCPRLTEKISKLSLDNSGYLQELIDADAIDDSTSGSTRNNLKSMNLADQVRHLLKETKLLTFRQLMELLPPPVDQQIVLRTVSTVGVLVRGNWIVRSDVIYPKNTCSSANGVSAEIMCRSRDYVLGQFTQHRYIDRIKIGSVVKLPTAELLEILQDIAILRRNKGWELRLPVDKDFIEKFPESVQRQEMWWDAKQRQLNESFRHNSQIPPTSPTKPRTPKSSARRRDSSFSSDGEGRGRTPVARQRKKSQSQGSDSEPRANGITTPSNRRRKSASISNDSDSGTESRHWNNNSDRSSKRTKRSVPLDDKASS